MFADTAGGLLLAGDHVLPHITPSIGFESAPTRLPLGDYLESLVLVWQLPDMRLLPAHGPVTASVHTRVDELLAHHDDRLETCLDAVARGAGTAYETARALRWTRRERSFHDLDIFNQMLATIETLAHVELLAAEARLERSEHDRTSHYTPARERRPSTGSLQESAGDTHRARPPRGFETTRRSPRVAASRGQQLPPTGTRYGCLGKPLRRRYPPP